MTQPIEKIFLIDPLNKNDAMYRDSLTLIWKETRDIRYIFTFWGTGNQISVKSNISSRSICCQNLLNTLSVEMELSVSNSVKYQCQLVWNWLQDVQLPRISRIGGLSIFLRTSQNHIYMKRSSEDIMVIILF